MTLQKWKVDALHSSLSFKIKHLAIATITGAFKSFSGSVRTESENFSGAAISFMIDASSLDTNNADRDKHLKSPDFLNTETFSTISFEGTMSGSKAVGNLTIGTVSRPITLDVEFEGLGKGRFGDVRAGFDVTGKINRKDFGLVWNLILETGQIVVGDEIKIQANIELIKED